MARAMKLLVPVLSTVIMWSTPTCSASELVPPHIHSQVFLAHHDLWRILRSGADHDARMVLDDTITIGALVTFTTYLGMMVWPLLALGWFFNLVQRGSASYDRIQDIMDTPNQIGADYRIQDQPDGGHRIRWFEGSALIRLLLRGIRHGQSGRYPVRQPRTTRLQPQPYP